MTDTKFKEIYQSNSNDLMQLCWIYFCEEKKTIPKEAFYEMFPNWIMTMNMPYVMSSGDIGGAVDNGLSRIEQFLKSKHKML